MALSHWNPDEADAFKAQTLGNTTKGAPPPLSHSYPPPPLHPHHTSTPVSRTFFWNILIVVGVHVSSERRTTSTPLTAHYVYPTDVDTRLGSIGRNTIGKQLAAGWQPPAHCDGTHAAVVSERALPGWLSCECWRTFSQGFAGKLHVCYSSRV